MPGGSATRCCARSQGTDRNAFRPYLTGVAVIATIGRLHPEVFRWRTRAYEFVEDICAFARRWAPRSARSRP